MTYIDHVTDPTCDECGMPLHFRNVYGVSGAIVPLDVYRSPSSAGLVWVLMAGRGDDATVDHQCGSGYTDHRDTCPARTEIVQ